MASGTRPHTASMRRATTSARDVLHIESALSRHKFMTGQAAASNAATHQMLRVVKVDEERPQLEHYQRGDGAFVDASRHGLQISGRARSSLPHHPSDRNVFDLDMRGLPRSPLHNSLFVRPWSGGGQSVGVGGVSGAVMQLQQAVNEEQPQQCNVGIPTPDEKWPPTTYGPATPLGGIERPQSAPLRPQQRNCSWHPLNVSQPSSSALGGGSSSTACACASTAVRARPKSSHQRTCRFQLQRSISEAVMGGCKGTAAASTGGILVGPPTPPPPPSARARDDEGPRPPSPMRHKSPPPKAESSLPAGVAIASRAAFFDDEGGDALAVALPPKAESSAYFSPTASAKPDPGIVAADMAMYQSPQLGCVSALCASAAGEPSGEPSGGAATPLLPPAPSSRGHVGEGGGDQVEAILVEEDREVQALRREKEALVGAASLPLHPRAAAATAHAAADAALSMVAEAEAQMNVSENTVHMAFAQTAQLPAAAAPLPVDTAAHDANGAATALAKLALFSQWKLTDLVTLCGKLPRREARRYETLYREGQIASAFYIVLSGAVTVTIAVEQLAHTASAATSAPATSASLPATTKVSAASSSASSTLSGGDALIQRAPKQIFDPSLGKNIGADAAVYEDTTLRAGGVFGVEALASSQMGEPDKALPRLQSASVQETATLLMLPTSLLASDRKLATAMEDRGTRRLAAQCVVQQALWHTPIFTPESRARIVLLARHFELRTFPVGTRIFEEGKRQTAFFILLQGRVVASQRTGWGRMRLALGTGGLGGSANASERILQSITRDAHVPFFGEQALSGERARPARGQPEELSPTTVRAAERTCVLALERERVADFLADFAGFRDLLVQRRHLTITTTMHQIAVQQAIEKHQQDVAHPSREMQEAMRLARTPNLQFVPKRYRQPSEPTPHPALGMSRAQRGKASEQALTAMLAGIEAVSVATKMGIAPRTSPADAPPSQQQLRGHGNGEGKGSAAPGARRASIAHPLHQKNVSLVDPWSTGPGRRSSMADRAAGIAPSLAGSAAVKETVGGRFLDAIWELQAARKVLE